MRTILLPLALLGMSSLAHADHCEFERIDTLTEELKGINQVEINALAGELEISSHRDAGVWAESRACAESKKYLSEIELAVEREGDTLHLTVIIAPLEEHWGLDYGFMDLQVKLPADMPVIVKDSSGNISLRQVSVSSIDDSSGKIKASNLLSDVRINDSSGDIILRGLQGSVEVSDSSGNIDLTDIKGDVNIRSDSSGEIEITRTSGVVVIGRDSSGDIDIDTTGGNVTINSDGSGGIQVSKVEGWVHIGTDGSGNIDIADVSGDFTVEAKGSGNIRTRRVDGKISTPR